ncbi:MAG: alpha/beta hydrolase [Acidimicrobiia bacterium]
MTVPIRIALLTLVIVALAIVGLWLAQRRLIYLPTGSPGSPPEVWQQATATTSDGLELAGWFLPGAPDRPIVIVFHGNAGNRGDRVVLGSRLAEAGLGVAMFDYRGYGGNAGSPSEGGLATDARAMVSWVEEHHPGRDIMYFGESLGAAVAVGVSVERPPHALILRSPFRSLSSVAAVHYPVLPVGLLLWDNYPVAEQIAHVDAPTTVIAGSADGTVPTGQSRDVYQAALDPAEWLLIDGADHNDASLSHGPAVIAAVRRAATQG